MKKISATVKPKSRDLTFISSIILYTASMGGRYGNLVCLVGYTLIDEGVAMVDDDTRGETVGF